MAAVGCAGWCALGARMSRCVIEHHLPTAWFPGVLPARFSWLYLSVALCQQRRTNDITDPFSLSIWQCERSEAPYLNRCVAIFMLNGEIYTYLADIAHCVFVSLFGACQGRCQSLQIHHEEESGSPCTEIRQAHHELRAEPRGLSLSMQGYKQISYVN